MSEITNAAPAGESEGASASEPLSLTAAASMLETSEREEQQEETTQTETDTSNTPAEPGNDDEGDGNDDQTEEPAGDEGEGGEETSQDDGTVEFDRLHGNTKVRLRDGTEWTVGELKRRIDDLRGLDDTRQKFTQEREQFTQWASQQAQQAQYIEQIAPQAIAAIQAQLPEIPPMPDLALRSQDPFAYQNAVDDRLRAIEDYNGKVAQMEEIQRAADMQTHQRQQEIQAQQAAFLQKQRVKLFELMPDLRDDTKRAEFAADVAKYATELYGFKPQEINQAYDYRLMLMARDAIAYRKLKANPPKPSQPKPQAAVPVAKPGRRPTAPEVQATRSNELTARIRKPGGLSMTEAASLLDDFEKG